MAVEITGTGLGGDRLLGIEVVGGGRSDNWNEMISQIADRRWNEDVKIVNQLDRWLRCFDFEYSLPQTQRRG